MTGVLAAGFAGGCAAVSTPGSLAMGGECQARSLQDPPAQVARGNARSQGLRGGVRDPRPEVLWGFASEDGRAGRVVNATDPEVARGNRSASCTLMLAQAGR
jgi:hypothetical protein